MKNNKINSSDEVAKRKALPLGVYAVMGDLSTVIAADADNSALGVALITSHMRVFIDKKESEYDVYGKLQSSYSDRLGVLRLPNPIDAIEIATNVREINDVLRSIGGDVIVDTWHWCGGRQHNAMKAYVHKGCDTLIGVESIYENLPARFVFDLL